MSYNQLFHEWDLIEASLAFDYGIILNKEFLESISYQSFSNLIIYLSSKSPLGKLEQLIATPNHELKNPQIILKNRYIIQRNKKDGLVDINSSDFWKG